MMRAACFVLLLSACGLKDDPLPVEATRALSLLQKYPNPTQSQGGPLTAARLGQHGASTLGELP